MPIDDRTSTQNYPKPNIANTLADDVGRLRTALDDIDADMAAKAPTASPTFTGTPAAPTAAADTNTTQLATTAFVVGQAGSISPAMDGTATVGSSLKYARADHVHPTDTSRATSTHVHGNITNAGAIGSTANLPIITTTSGVLTAGSFGTAANTFCQGNDARLSDTRTPTDGSVTTAKIGDDQVTYAKIQNVTATDRLLGRSTAGAGDIEEITCTAAGRALLDDADAAAQRTTLGLGTLATQSGTFSGTSSGTNTGDQTITLTGDVTGSGTGSFTTAIAAGVIVDADINASAAIAHTKLASITAGQLLMGNASNVPTATAVTGDVTISSSGVTAIGSGVIVNADINASAAIADTKLATISTAGKVSNSATTATSANTASAIVARDANGDIGVTSINNGPLAGMRNAIVNGSMAIAQRGTSFVAGANNDDTYNLDRWYVLSDGNDVVDITQNTTTVPTNGKYAIALDVETVNKKFGIAQIIEADNCIGLIGGQVTLSFKARVSATTNLDNIKAAIVAWSGTADTVTSDIISAWNVEGTNPTLIANATYENTPANLNLTTSYATYSVTATVDTASTTNIIVFIWSDVTTTSLGEFLYITDVQLEAGPVATPFERRPIGVELALCQRYYCIVGTAGLQRHGTGYITSTTAAAIMTPFPVAMRAAPDSLEQSGTAADYQLTHGNNATICSAVPTFTVVSPFSAVTTFTVASGLTVGQGAMSRNNGGGGYLAWSAEL